MNIKKLNEEIRSLISYIAEDEDKLQNTNLQEVAKKVFSDIDTWAYQFCDWELFCNYAKEEGYDISDYDEVQGLNELKELGYNIIEGKDGINYITLDLTKEDIDTALDDMFS